ncbi:MAG: bifunctional phosphoribosyl-AMP cyclohydrolase/phosphoribosyl-ATP diphosphatase HisIE [Dehalococcoidia bacterium]
MIKLDEKGLIPAIVQDDATGKVLTLAYMDQEALRKTLETGQVWFYSRSRAELWHKGATSGNYLNLRGLSIDCDGDALLVRAEPTGPTCHTGNETCFFRELPSEDLEFEREPGPLLDELFQIIQERKRTMPQDSYVAGLFREGTGRIAKKVIEEAGESAVAALEEGPESTVREVADLWFHTLVLLADRDLTPQQVWEELRARRR